MGGVREEIELIGYVWKLQVGILSSYVNLNFLNTKHCKQIKELQKQQRYYSNKLMQGFIHEITNEIKQL